MLRQNVVMVQRGYPLAGGHRQCRVGSGRNVPVLLSSDNLDAFVQGGALFQEMDYLGSVEQSSAMQSSQF